VELLDDGGGDDDDAEDTVGGAGGLYLNHGDNDHGKLDVGDVSSCVRNILLFTIKFQKGGPSIFANNQLIF
jgi:hypothetical protein